MSALRALFTAASASGLLPWILVALLAAFGTVGSMGFYAGHHWAASSCEADKLTSNVAALNAQARAVAKAQATSDKIWDIGLTLNVDMAVQRTRTLARTQEVIRYVDAAPDLAGCRVPDGVQRVRADQVRDSARIAAGQPVLD